MLLAALLGWLEREQRDVIVSSGGESSAESTTDWTPAAVERYATTASRGCWGSGWDVAYFER